MELLATPSSASSEVPRPARSLSRFRERRFWLLPAFSLLFVVPIILALFVAPLAVREVISGMGQFLAVLGAALSSFWVVRRSPPGRIRQAWLLIMLALIAYLIAEGIIIYIAVAIPTPTATASVADVFFLPFYPLFALGVIRLPATGGQDAERVRSLIDAAIIVIALLSVSIVFLIGPRLASGTPVDFVFGAYPIADFTLLLVLVLLLFRGILARYRPIFFWLALGMLCFIYADSAFNYLDLSIANYGGGTPYVDPFWVIGALAFMMAAFYSLAPMSDTLGPGWRWLGGLRASSSVIQDRDSQWNTIFLLYGPVIVLFGLLLFQIVAHVSKPFIFPAILLLAFLETLLIITRQILTARDLVEARSAIIKAQQLDELKDQFITSVNHELRTPVMTMQGYIEILDEMHVQIEPDKRGEMLTRARRANTALVSLLQSILDTRRIDQEVQGIVLEPVNVYATVKNALELMDPREGIIGERLFYLQVPHDLMVWGEAVRLQQVFSNLLTNAIKYSQPNTEIHMTAKVGSAERKRFRRARGVAPSVEITVQDQGLGVPPEQIPLLFNRFVRLPRDLASQVRGTGLGLYLCRVFIEAMGGRIWLESTGVPGRGSTFYIRLPLPPQTT